MDVADDTIRWAERTQSLRFAMTVDSSSAADSRDRGRWLSLNDSIRLLTLTVSSSRVAEILACWRRPKVLGSDQY